MADTDDGSLDSATAALLAKHTATQTPAAEAPDEEQQDQQEQPQGEVEPGDEQGDPEQAESEQEEAEPETPEPKTPTIPDDAKITLRVGDQDREVTVAEMKRGYLREADYTRKTQEVGEARKQFVAQAQQYEGHIQSQLQEVGFLAQTLMQQLVQEQSGTNWDELRTKNPAEYAAKLQDMQQRRDLLGRSYKAYQEAQQRQAGLGTEQYQQHVAEQAQQLLTEIPEWIDTRVRQTEQKAVAKFLLDMGVPEQSVASLADAKTVAIARMAMLYKQQQSARDKAKQKMARPVPPVQKTGVRDQNPLRSSQSKMMDAAKKSGRAEDFGAALASKYR